MSSSQLGERPRTLLLWFAACTALGLLLTAQEAIGGFSWLSWSDLPRVLESRLMQSYVTGLTSVFAWRAARTVRVSGVSWWSKSALHIAVLCVYAFMSVVSVSTARYWVDEAMRASFSWSQIVLATFERSVSFMGLLYGLVVLAESLAAAVDAGRARAVENAELRGRLSEAHLESLRLQLQPHFLFNTLHTASALIDSRPAAARRVLSDLGDLLRASLDGGPEPEISLGRELDLLGRYIDIQRARFGDRLTFRVEVPQECLGLAVPPMILQPFVENALRHGLADRPGRGEIRVECAGESSQSGENSILRMTIADDGRGLSEGVLREGVGLGNTRARLLGLYGSRAGIDIEPNPGGGTVVRIYLPARPLRMPVQASAT